jgi:glutamyl-tRNA reductase
MIEQLRALNLPATFSPKENYPGVFLLQTCARVLLVYLAPGPVSLPTGQIFSGREAYNFLLEVLCGLHSPLIGEHEIVAQFRKAYQRWPNDPHRDTRVMRLIEKLFQDAKKIRTQVLHGISNDTWPGVARKILGPHRPQSLLILGSGDLALDMIDTFSGKMDLFLSSRNQSRIQSLPTARQINIIEWKNFESWAGFPFILNTIGAPVTILHQSFFTVWRTKHPEKRLFLDFGTPSIIEVESENGDLLLFENLIGLAASLGQEKHQRIAKAQENIRTLSLQRTWNNQTESRC